MPDISTYNKYFDFWSSLIDYFISNNEKYKLDLADNYDDNSTIILTYLRNKCKQYLSFDKKLCDSFDRFLRDSKSINKSHISQDNIYRLLFILDIESADAAQYFCIDYAHTNALSVRHYNDFVVLCGINIQCSYQDIYPYLLDADKLRAFDIAPKKLEYNVTSFMYNNIFSNHTLIHSLEQMSDYLNNPANMNQFALTRNSAYLWLFDFANWLMFSPDNWKAFFNAYPDFKPLNSDFFTETDWEVFCNNTFNHGVSPEIHNALVEFYFSGTKEARIISTKQLTTISDDDDMKPLYKTRSTTLHSHFLEKFGLAWYDSNDRLSEDEINALAIVFPNIFMTYNSYNDLFHRRKRNNISSGTVLLCSLPYVSLERDPAYDNDEYVIEFSDKKHFIDSCNYILLETGCARLNYKAPFDRLLIDTYDETYASAADLNPDDFRTEYIVRLRNNLRLFIS